MGRQLAGGLLGQPPVVGGQAVVTSIEAVNPDTTLNLKALKADQKDPDTDIAEFLAAGVSKWRLLYDGSVLGTGALGTAGTRIGAFTGTSLDLSGNGVIAGDLTVNGNLNAAVVAADSLDVDGTNGEASGLALGEVVQIDPVAVKTVRRAKADAMATSDVLGCARAAIAAGAQGKIRHAGIMRILLVAGLAGADVPDEGKEVYLSATTGGRGTTIAPSAAGQFIAPLGTIWDASSYGVDSTVLVHFRRGTVVGT